MIAHQGGKEFQVTIILDRNGTTGKNQDPDMMKLFFALCKYNLYIYSWHSA